MTRKMKESGVEWIGEIPDDWEIIRLKNVASICNGGEYKGLEVFEGGYPIMGSGGEFGRSSAYMYDKPCVLLGRKGTVDKPLFIDKPFWAVDTMYYTKIKKGYNCKFFYYLCKNIHFDYYQYGSAVPSMTQRDLNEVLFSVPPLQTQNRIASFLDTKSFLIDTTIQKEREVITKLKEYRQAVITEAVTKGIRPGVPMKDSGVEWIGEIPEHWKITSLKNIVDIRDGTHDTPRYIDEGNDTYPLISSKDFVNGKIDYSECKWISFEDYKSICMRSKVESGDVLMSMIGGNIGKSIIVKENPHFAIKNVALFKTGLNKSLATLLHLYFSTTLLKTQIDLKSRGGAQDFLGLTDIRNLVWVFMGESEQQEIADYLDTKCSDIDATIQKRELAIEKLTAYKQSLIYECVTGKKEVLG